MLSSRHTAVGLLVFMAWLIVAGCADRRDLLRDQDAASLGPRSGALPPATLPPQAQLAITTPPQTTAALSQPSTLPPQSTTVSVVPRGAAPSAADGALVQASAPAPAFQSAPPSTNDSPLRILYQRAAARYATINSYIARMRRREEVNGKTNPEEVMVFRFRKQPWSVYFKWIGSEGQGREVVYVKGQYGDMIHTLLAPGDHPFMAGGKQMSVSPDNIFIRSRTRHSIRDAGIGSIIDRYGLLVEAFEKGDKHAGTVSYLGQQKRPEYSGPVDVVERDIPPGAEPQLPRGGRRWLFFDSASSLPVLTITHDDKGHEVEYYCYDQIQPNVKLDDDDFNPDKLWPTKR